MVKVVIIEDEPAALRRLQRLILELRPNWGITGTADSISSGIDLIDEADFELIFSDIQLSDGQCFDIFSKTNNQKPIIFITAYDKYAIKAFDFNSIHYLLKPIKPEQLLMAIQKFEQSEVHSFANHAPLFNKGIYKQPTQLLSKIGNKSNLISVENIAAIVFEDRATIAIMENGSHHLLDQSLDKLEEYLSSDLFFRISRQMIVAKSAVKHFSNFTSNRLILETHPILESKAIVSKDRVPSFRKWIAPEI